jgi:Holliday junction resolvase RusA-like endonuclease
MQTLSLKIFGEPASKANNRKAVIVNGKSMFIKSAKALNYAKMFKQQAVVPPLLKFISEDVAVVIRIWYASRRPDLDESLILDLLQDVAYLNDRQVKEKHIYWMGVDKENPRCEIEVSPMQTK